MNSRLLRDRVPDMIRATGADPILHQADPIELQVKLRERLSDDVRRFLTREFGLDELVDVLELVRALATSNGVSLKDLERARAVRAASHGTFKERTIWSGN